MQERDDEIIYQREPPHKNTLTRWVIENILAKYDLHNGCMACLDGKSDALTSSTVCD